MNDFYVGYLPKAPTTLARFVRRVILALGLIAPIITPHKVGCWEQSWLDVRFSASVTIACYARAHQAQSFGTLQQRRHSAESPCSFT